MRKKGKHQPFLILSAKGHLLGHRQIELVRRLYILQRDMPEQMQPRDFWMPELIPMLRIIQDVPRYMLLWLLMHKAFFRSSSGTAPQTWMLEWVMALLH